MDTLETVGAAMLQRHSARIRVARDVARVFGSAAARFASWWAHMVVRSPQTGIHLG